MHRFLSFQSPGFLVPWRDPQLFADRVADILIDPSLQRRMGRAARPSVEQYAWSRVAQEHLALYAELLPGQQQRLAESPG